MADESPFYRLNEIRPTRRIKQRYVLIGGFASHERYTPKTVLLYEGNKFGETLIQYLQTLPADTPYSEVQSAARDHASKLSVRLGRKFLPDEWAGKVVAKLETV